MEQRVAALEYRMKRLFFASILCSVVVNPVIVAALLLAFGKSGREPQPSITTGRQEINLAGPIGDSPSDAAPPDSGSRKTWLTTAEVAAREHIAQRTLLNWIEAGRLVPAPAKSARSWIIPAAYRITPPEAADGRNP